MADVIEVLSTFLPQGVSIHNFDIETAVAMGLLSFDSTDYRGADLHDQK